MSANPAAARKPIVEPAVVLSCIDIIARETMRKNLASYMTTAPGFFNGFAAPDLDAIAAFSRSAAVARDHYRLKPVARG